MDDMTKPQYGPAMEFLLRRMAVPDRLMRIEKEKPRSPVLPPPPRVGLKFEDINTQLKPRGIELSSLSKGHDGYIRTNSKHLFICLAGMEHLPWQTRLAHVLRDSSGCPKCSRNKTMDNLRR